MLLLWIALILLAVAVYYVTKNGSDPYGNFHVSLNKIPGDEGPPRTEWLNMGYWKLVKVRPSPMGIEHVFDKLFQALALRLIESASLKVGGRVLDVGHGSGDSLLLLLSHPAVPRPGVIHGITSLSEHHTRSYERVGLLLSANPGVNRQSRVLLHDGDAIYQLNSRLDHPLSPYMTYSFDTILALDCAYHFHTRFEFLRQSFLRLTPGGRIALADICFSSKPKGFWFFVLFSLLRVIPRENIVTKERYVRDLQDIGYVDVRMEDVSEWVFPGFRKFLKEQGAPWGLFGRAIELLEREGRFVIVTGTRP
ncbi:hypothetical protein EW146_g3738 [Bondarzewia mesenterica]|uniref:Methyltransferase type 11 domain-containing protein n=1 Tax=Bondarzewia mesenterica TaxID=1095465 RepID=A0A4S4M2H1_9AGAM|nr:hypothetical protein EW146_g3738 [Bondarzewia mesenterica]